MELRKRPYENVPSSTPRVKPKKVKRREELNQVSPVESRSSLANESLEFVDAPALNSPNLAAWPLAKQLFSENTDRNVVGTQDLVPHDAPNSSSNFGRPHLAPQPRPPEQEEYSAVDAAQQQPTHASQASSSASSQLQGSLPAILHVSEQQHIAPEPRRNAIDTMSNDGRTSPRCRLPPFWRSQPAMWFLHAEASMAQDAVNSDEGKYRSVVASLDMDTLSDLADSLVAPPAEGKYDALKECALQRFTEPPERQLQRVFNEIRLDGRKPSQLHRYMCTLAGETVPECAVASAGYRFYQPRFKTR